jgi:GntR family transcriptional regulator, carbon starvation induced regulator
MPADPPETRTNWAETRLRSALITGEIAPGSPIRAERLAEEWQISATPLREALRALTSEGLVTSESNRGSRASGVSVETSKEIYELRLMLEPTALRLSLLNVDDAWRQEVDNSWEDLQKAWHEPTDLTEVEPAHTAFHQALISACGSDSLMRLTRQLSIQSIRFRLLSAASRGGMAGAHEEHDQLYKACVALEIDRAVELCTAHIGLTAKTMLGPQGLKEIASKLGQGNQSRDQLQSVLERVADE